MKDGFFIGTADLAARHLTGSAMPRIVAFASKMLVGRTIKQAGYVVLDGEPWPCLVLDDNTVLTAQRDDEGNGPGALCISRETIIEMLCQTRLKR